MTSPDSAYVRGIQWTPDDHALLTFKTAANGTTTVYRVPVATGVEQPIGLAMEGLAQLRIDPRGSRVGFAGGTGGSELWVMSGFLPSKSAIKHP
jgi:hypothetical protein